MVGKPNTKAMQQTFRKMPPYILHPYFMILCCLWLIFINHCKIPHKKVACGQKFIPADGFTSRPLESGKQEGHAGKQNHTMDVDSQQPTPQAWIHTNNCDVGTIHIGKGCSGGCSLEEECRKFPSGYLFLPCHDSSWSPNYRENERTNTRSCTS